MYTDDIISCRLILTNGSIVFSSITDSGASPDTGSYRCIAEKIGSGGKVHRIATPEVFLRSACKTFCNCSPSFYTLLNSAGYSLLPSPSWVMPLPSGCSLSLHSPAVTCHRFLWTQYWLSIDSVRSMILGLNSGSHLPTCVLFTLPSQHLTFPSCLRWFIISDDEA